MQKPLNHRDKPEWHEVKGKMNQVGRPLGLPQRYVTFYLDENRIRVTSLAPPPEAAGQGRRFARSFSRLKVNLRRGELGGLGASRLTSCHSSKLGGGGFSRVSPK